MRPAPPKIRIGISGTGFIAQGLAQLLTRSHPRFDITHVLTRRTDVQPLTQVPEAKLTRDPAHLVESCDIVIECSGTVGGAARVAIETTRAGVPLVTMNAEFQLTLGACFAASGLVREARGDQPGSLAALDAEARLMGFEPLVYASQKGFLNPHPTPDDMQFWADKQGISVPSTVSFTDGTKMQIEQALVANGLNADIAQDGLVGAKTDTLAEGGQLLARKAVELGRPISDYVLMAGGQGEVFIVAHHIAPPEHLRYYKLGDGPFYLLQRPFHLGHLEVPLTLQELLNGQPPSLTAGTTPRISVAAYAKSAMCAGQYIERAIGSFAFYGRAVRTTQHPDHVPIGLLEACRLKASLAPGQQVHWDDVELTDEVAWQLAKTLYPVRATLAMAVS